MVWKSIKINQVYLLLYQMSQSELRIISESPENRLRVFSELSQSRHRVTSESSHCRLRVSTEFSQSLLHAVSKVVSSYLRVFIIELTLVFWYFLYFKLLQTIEWNLKERKWRIFCTFSKKNIMRVFNSGSLCGLCVLQFPPTHHHFGFG